MTAPTYDGQSGETMNRTNLVIAASLTKLGHIIDTELQNWLTYLTQIPPSTLSDITSGPLTPQTKIAALRHLLEIMPARHKALASAYKAENLDFVSLSDQCATLLEGLGDADLTGFYDHKVLKAKKFRQEAVAMDEETRALETGRLDDLKELMSMYEELVLLNDETPLGVNQLQVLVEAMDEIGLSAASAVADGVSSEMEGNRDNSGGA